MKRFWLLLVFLPHAAVTDDAMTQILVTFENSDSGYQASGFQPPYRARKRYPVSATIRKTAKSIASQYALIELERWPLKSLSVYCFVYEVAADKSAFVVAELSNDARIESVQIMNRFETQSSDSVTYDDEYLSMQHSLNTTDVLSVHRLTRGKGVRIAVVDSDADDKHEDLRGVVTRSRHIGGAGLVRDKYHGTAVASVIGARANNALGIVGVAPEATLQVAEACWSDSASEKAICDTFSLARALDAMTDSPPDVINLSLAGPEDALLQRIIDRLIKKGAVVVAASPNIDSETFPASMSAVISVASVGENAVASIGDVVFAPGERILVAIPSDDYEFRSGSSLAAAHITGIVALLIAASDDLEFEEIRQQLLLSQSGSDGANTAVNACRALRVSKPDIVCDQSSNQKL